MIKKTNIDANNQDIQLLQTFLKQIRILGGWTAEEFGDKIGVTKQTISNLENKKTSLSKTQYIAIRAVVDYEIQSNPEIYKLLNETILLIFDDDGEIQKNFLEDFKKEKLEESIKIIAAYKTAGIAVTSIASLLSPIIGVSTAALIGALAVQKKTPALLSWLRNLK